MRNALRQLVEEVRKMMESDKRVPVEKSNGDPVVNDFPSLFPLGIDRVRAAVEGWGVKLELELVGPPPGRNETDTSKPR
jgi:hypothetical protein